MFSIINDKDHEGSKTIQNNNLVINELTQSLMYSADIKSFFKEYNNTLKLTINNVVGKNIEDTLGLRYYEDKLIISFRKSSNKIINLDKVSLIKITHNDNMLTIVFYSDENIDGNISPNELLQLQFPIISELEKYKIFYREVKNTIQNIKMDYIMATISELKDVNRMYDVSDKFYNSIKDLNQKVMELANEFNTPINIVDELLKEEIDDK